MKIKCKKCGKRFEPDMYSGLCPKCGTYNGSHMTDTDVSQYLSSGYSAEASHQQLHERYGDTGHDEGAHRNLHEAYDQSFEAAHPVHDHGKVDAVPAPKKKRFGFTAVLAALLVIIPLVSVASYQIWEKQKVKELLSGEIGQVPLQDGNTLIFSGEPFEAPVEVTVSGTDIVEIEELSEIGKVLVAVKAKATSERYSFDAKVNKIALKYEHDGKVFYQQSVDSYYMEDYLSELGLTEEDLLATYGVGNGSEQEGYWFFCVHKDAEKPELLLMAGKGRGDDIVFLEGTIPLDFSAHTELSEGEVSP